jgi:XTP/dITP diphosphohydrolase
VTRLGRGDRLVLASHNKGKLREIEALLVPFGVAVVSAGSLGLPEPEETEPDFAGNARLKAVAAARASGIPALADDSGFCVAALGGAPGVFSARWAGPGKDFAAAMARVNDQASGPSHAWFVCALCLAWPGGDTATYLGRVDGRTCWPRCQLRRDGPRRETRQQPPGAGVFVACGGLFATGWPGPA